MDDENWIVFCSNVTYSIAKSDKCQRFFIPTSHKQDLKKNDCIWQSSVSASPGLVRIHVTCDMEFSNDWSKNNDMHVSLINSWRNSAELYISSPHDEMYGYATKKIKPSDFTYYHQDIDFPHFRTVLSFVAEFKSDIFAQICSNYTINDGVGNTTLPKKLFLCFTLRKSICKSNSIIKFPGPIKMNQDNTDLSFLLSRNECLIFINKFGSIDDAMITSFRNTDVDTSHDDDTFIISSVLYRILLPVVWSNVYTSINDVEYLISHLTNIYINRDYSHEAVILFLQFMHGKRDGFTYDEIKPQHFNDFIKIASSSRIMSSYIPDVLYIFTNYAHGHDEFIIECLWEVLRCIVDLEKKITKGYCQFISMYFAQNYESLLFRNLVKGVIADDVEISKIKIEFERKHSIAKSLMFDEILACFSQAIFTRLLERFDSVCKDNQWTTDKLTQRYDRFLRDNNWHYLRRTYMINPIENNVCVCRFDNRNSVDAVSLNSEQIPFEDDFYFLNLVENVEYIVASKPSRRVIQPALYFEFRFSKTKHANFILSLPSPLAYLRWPWFKSMIDCGMEESKTKSLTLPYGVSPEVMFVIACCLSNILVINNVSMETLEWIRSDESGIIGIKDNDGNPYPVFKQLFV